MKYERRYDEPRRFPSVGSFVVSLGVGIFLGYVIFWAGSQLIERF